MCTADKISTRNQRKYYKKVSKRKFERSNQKYYDRKEELF